MAERDENDDVETLSAGHEGVRGQARDDSITIAFDDRHQRNGFGAPGFLGNRMDFHGMLVSAKAQAHVAVGIVDFDGDSVAQCFREIKTYEIAFRNDGR
jgi:hypothetical protein